MYIIYHSYYIFEMIKKLEKKYWYDWEYGLLHRLKYPSKYDLIQTQTSCTFVVYTIL